MALVISLLLISSISAMIWIGPRVSMVMGEDYKVVRFLGKKNKYDVPVIAIWFQAVISIILIISSTFDKVLVYTGFILNFFTLLCVIGVFILRFKSKKGSDSYRLPGFPFTPLLFIFLSLWTLVYLFIERTLESVLGMVTVLTGSVIYLTEKLINKPR